jgi:hypothetical protein
MLLLDLLGLDCIKLRLPISGSFLHLSQSLDFPLPFLLLS